MNDPSSHGLDHDRWVDSHDDLDIYDFGALRLAEGLTSIVGKIPSRTDATRGNMLRFKALTFMKLPIPAHML